MNKDDMLRRDLMTTQEAMEAREYEPVQDAPDEYDVRNQNKGERKRNKSTRWR